MHIICDRGGALFGGVEFFFEELNMGTGGIGEGVFKGFPHISGCGCPGDKRGNRGGQGADEAALEEGVLAAPGDVGWVRGGGVACGDVFGGFFEGAIDIREQIVAKEEGVNGIEPCYIVRRGKL